jgi:hypothetical protein
LRRTKTGFAKKKVPKDREKPHHGTITEKSGGSEIHRSLEFHDQFSATTIETRHTMKNTEKIAESESSTLRFLKAKDISTPNKLAL